MIVCVTPNPAVDRTLVVPRLVPGAVHRTTRAIVAAGGKGLNAARVMLALGGKPLCLGFLGGHTGRLVADLAEREGLRGSWTWIREATRTCVILVQENGGESTVVNEPGPNVTEAEWAALAGDIVRESQATRWICFCGSLPLDSSADTFARLLQDLVARGREVWVDSSGPALAAAARVEGINLKINAVEAAAILGGVAITDSPAAVGAARRLREAGVARAVLTLGREGAVAATAEGCWHARPPALAAVSDVGSGDAFLGAWMLARAQGRPAGDGLRRAAAAGAANALSIGGGQVNPADFERLIPEIVCRECG